jgi:hypothetical protein
MPLRVGWHQAVRVFCVDYPGKMCEITWSGFDRG